MPDESFVEWIKPIMFTGGIGQMNDMHIYKHRPRNVMKVVRLGGPAYRIGVGGGAASSRIQEKERKARSFCSPTR